MKEVKLVRIRDISLYHMEGINPKVGVDKVMALEHDMISWFKNFLMTCDELSVRPVVTMIGDNDKDHDSLHTN